MIKDKKMAQVMAVHDKYTDELLKKPHVVGVSVRTTDSSDGQPGQPALVVLVNRLVPDDRISCADHIPFELDGVPVVIHEVGTLEAF